MENSSYMIRSVAIDITNKCNFRCLHCYNYSGEHNRESEMSDQEILNIINEICDYQPDSICLCGGEPLLRVGLIYKICDLVKNKNSNNVINMVSNGYFLNDEIANNLKEKGLGTIQISLDGSKPISHNWIRQNELAYDKAIKAIKIAVKSGLTVNVACCPTIKNFGELGEVIQKCIDLGVSMVRFQPLMIMGRGTGLRNFSLSDEQYMQLALMIREQSVNNRNISIEWGDPTEHLVNIIFAKNTNSFLDLSVTAYGDIMISPYVPVKIGNLRCRTLKEYLDQGLQNIYLDNFIKKVAGMITDWNKMNLNEYSNVFPKLGMEKNINYDILDIQNRDVLKIKRIMEMDIHDKNIEFK